jgi:hypothetical protein
MTHGGGINLLFQGTALLYGLVRDTVNSFIENSSGGLTHIEKNSHIFINFRYCNRRMLCLVHVIQIVPAVAAAVPAEVILRKLNRLKWRSRTMLLPDLLGKLKIKFW